MITNSRLDALESYLQGDEDLPYWIKDEELKELIELGRAANAVTAYVRRALLREGAE